MAFVYPTTALKRYRFPTHVNDLVFDRSEARCSEAFIVVLAPGEAPPRHKHDDTEQVFFILEGGGTLTIDDDRRQAVSPGDVVLIPPGTWHTIRAEGGTMRYLAIDCFLADRARDEPTWDEHVRAMCHRNGWEYAQVVGEPPADAGEPGT